MTTYESRYPHRVLFSAISAFDSFNERLSAIDCIFVNIVGVNDGYVELCVDSDSPTLEERVAWDWLVNPELSEAVLPFCDGYLAKLIRAWADSEMDWWWRDMACSD